MHEKLHDNLHDNNYDINLPEIAEGSKRVDYAAMGIKGFNLRYVLATYN